MGTRGQFMSDGGGEVLVAKVLQPPSDCRNVRESKYAGLHAAAHGQWDLESGDIRGKSGAQRFHQCFLDGPEMVKQVKSVVSASQCQLGSLVRPHHAVDESIEITPRAAFLHVHTQPPLGGYGNQAIHAAVTDIEADGGRLPID